VSPSRSERTIPGMWPITPPSSEPPPFKRESISEKIDTMRMPCAREMRSQAVSIARKWRGLPWKFETITLRKPWIASERPMSSRNAIVVEGRNAIVPGCGTPSVAAHTNGSFRNVRERWRSGRKRSARSARPSPSRQSAPSGRCGPCTSIGEQVTNTTACSRSIASNCVLVSVSQRRQRTESVMIGPALALSSSDRARRADSRRGRRSSRSTRSDSLRRPRAR
jgi:hypothetical protein